MKGNRRLSKGGQRRERLDLFLIQAPDLYDKRVNFFRCQFARILRHPVLAVRDDVMQVIGGRGACFFGHQRWPPKAPALGRFPVALRAILLEYRVRREASFRRRRLRRKCNGQENQTAKKETESENLQAKPRSQVR